MFDRLAADGVMKAQSYIWIGALMEFGDVVHAYAKLYSLIVPLYPIVFAMRSASQVEVLEYECVPGERG